MTDTILPISYTENKSPYITIGDFEIRLENEKPDAETLKVAVDELRETPDIVQPAIEELRNLLKNDTKLHVPTDDDFLIMFLRPCKYYAKSAFQRIQTFYKVKASHGSIFEDLRPCIVRHVYEQELVKLIPVRDIYGRRALWIEAGKKWKPSQCSLNDLFRAIQVAIQASMMEPKTQICGGIVIMDFDGLSLNHIMQFTPSFAAMILQWVQDTLSLRLKAVHIVNNSYLFNMLFAIFKPFIREKLRKRIYFHGKDYKLLRSQVGDECLPTRYGGKVIIPEGTGVQLANLFQLYSKDFEMANTFGYNKSDN